MTSPNKHLVDRKLIESLKNGSVPAFKKIFNLYEKRLYFFVFSYTKSAYISEEIIQEVFIKIWEERKKLNSKKSFHSYIFTIAKNRTLNFLRDVSKRESVKKELWINISKQYEHVIKDIVLADYQELVDDIVETLPQTKRSVYILSVQEGKTHSEIASLLGIQVKTVKNHLWKAKETIKLQLHPHIDTIIKLIILCILF